MFCLVEFWIMPAIASEPPDGISTVVEALRSLIEGTVAVSVDPGTVMVSEFSVERSDTSVATLRLMRPWLRTTGVKLRATPNFLKSIEGWQGEGAPAAAGEAVKHRKFAAGVEGRLLSGDSGEIRLGERVDDAGLLHRLQCRGDRRGAGGETRAGERLAGGRERIGVVQIHHGRAEADRARKIDAELLDDIALDLGDRHFEHDLVAAAHHDGIDDLVARGNARARARSDQTHRDIEGLLRLGLARCATAQDNALAYPLNADVGIGQDLTDRRADAVEIAGDGDVEAGHLPAFDVEEEHIGLPDLAADNVGAARGADHGVGDGGIGDQHVLDIARQVDDDRLADAERDRARPEIARRNRDCLGLQVAIRRSTAGNGDARSSARRGDHGCESSGADRFPWWHGEVPLYRSARHCLRRHAEAYGVHGTALVVALLLAAFGSGRLRVEKATQGERDRAELARQRENLRLPRIELDGRGLSDHDLLAVLLTEDLIDREHPHVLENCFADVFLDAAVFLRRLVATGEHDIDVVVGQDEAARPGFGRDI